MIFLVHTTQTVASPTPPKDPPAEEIQAQNWQSAIATRLLNAILLRAHGNGLSKEIIAALDRDIKDFLLQAPVPSLQADTGLLKDAGTLGNRYRDSVEIFFEKREINPEAQLVFYYAYIENDGGYAFEQSDIPNETEKREAVKRFRSLLLSVSSIPTQYLASCEDQIPGGRALKRLDQKTYDLYCFMHAMEEKLK